MIVRVSTENAVEKVTVDEPVDLYLEARGGQIALMARKNGASKCILYYSIPDNSWSANNMLSPYLGFRTHGTSNYLEVNNGSPRHG